jgi:hypothetical protein
LRRHGVGLAALLKGGENVITLLLNNILKLEPLHDATDIVGDSAATAMELRVARAGGTELTLERLDGLINFVPTSANMFGLGGEVLLKAETDAGERGMSRGEELGVLRERLVDQGAHPIDFSGDVQKRFARGLVEAGRLDLEEERHACERCERLLHATADAKHAPGLIFAALQQADEIVVLAGALINKVKGAAEHRDGRLGEVLALVAALGDVQESLAMSDERLAVAIKSFDPCDDRDATLLKRREGGGEIIPHLGSHGRRRMPKATRCNSP